MTMKIDAVEADEEEARFRHFERESAKVCTDALKYLVSELREKREEGISPEWNYPHFSLRQYADFFRAAGANLKLIADRIEKFC
jgi:hypothetical protein